MWQSQFTFEILLFAQQGVKVVVESKRILLLPLILIRKVNRVSFIITSGNLHAFATEALVVPELITIRAIPIGLDLKSKQLDMLIDIERFQIWELDFRLDKAGSDLRERLELTDRLLFIDPPGHETVNVADANTFNPA